MIEALIFDFDGVILDTELPEFRSWQEVYAQYGCTLPLSVWSTWVGGGGDGFDPYRFLEGQIDQTVDRSAIRDMRRPRFAELVAVQPIMPGIEDLLNTADEHGLKLGVASSSSRSWVNGHLVERGLIDRFEIVLTADDVAVVKPDPSLYRRSVEVLNVAPSHALAIEDSRNGLLAAKHAGLKCAVVPNAITQHMSFEEADMLLESLADMAPAQLLDVFQ